MPRLFERARQVVDRLVVGLERIPTRFALPPLPCSIRVLSPGASRRQTASAEIEVSFLRCHCPGLRTSPYLN